MGKLICILLEIYRSLQQWKNSANRPRIDTVIAMVRVAHFFDSRCRKLSSQNSQYTVDKQRTYTSSFRHNRTIINDNQCNLMNNLCLRNISEEYVHCKLKKTPKCFLSYILQTPTDSGKVWYTFSWINLSYRNVNVFVLVVVVKFFN